MPGFSSDYSAVYSIAELELRPESVYKNRIKSEKPLAALLLNNKKNRVKYPARQANITVFKSDKSNYKTLKTFVRWPRILLVAQ